MSNRRKKNTEDVKNAEEKYTFGSREGKKFENITAIVLFFIFLWDMCTLISQLKLRQIVCWAVLSEYCTVLKLESLIYIFLTQVG